MVADARRELLREISYYENERKGFSARFRRAAEAGFILERSRDRFTRRLVVIA
jgi:hypothetical protein